MDVPHPFKEPGDDLLMLYVWSETQAIDDLTIERNQNDDAKPLPDNPATAENIPQPGRTRVGSKRESPGCRADGRFLSSTISSLRIAFPPRTPIILPMPLVSSEPASLTRRRTSPAAMSWVSGCAGW